MEFKQMKQFCCSLPKYKQLVIFRQIIRKFLKYTTMCLINQFSIKYQQIPRSRNNCLNRRRNSKRTLKFYEENNLRHSCHNTRKSGYSINRICYRQLQCKEGNRIITLIKRRCISNQRNRNMFKITINTLNKIKVT